MIQNLERLTACATFSARNQIGDPRQLWELSRPVVGHLQDILDNKSLCDALSGREIKTMTRCYHDLAYAASVFSLAADTELQKIVCTEPSQNGWTPTQDLSPNEHDWSDLAEDLSVVADDECRRLFIELDTVLEKKQQRA